MPTSPPCATQLTVHVGLDLTLGARRIPYAHLVDLAQESVRRIVFATADPEVVHSGVDVTDCTRLTEGVDQLSIDVGLGLTGDAIVSDRDMGPLVGGDEKTRVVPGPGIVRPGYRKLDLTRIGRDAEFVLPFLVDDDLRAGTCSVVVDPGLHGDIVGHLEAGVVRDLNEIATVEREVDTVRSRHRYIVDRIDGNVHHRRGHTCTGIVHGVGKTGIGRIVRGRGKR